MIMIDLDSAHQKRLDSLAEAQGQDGATLARSVLVDFLDFHALPTDSDADWAEASIALAPEVIGEETWDDPAHES